MSTFTITCPKCGTFNRISPDKEGKVGRCGHCHAALPPFYFQPQPLTDSTFDAFVARYPGPILAEFWAPW